MHKARLRISERGFSLVEVTLAITLGGVIFSLFVGMLMYAQDNAVVAASNRQAAAYAHAGLEAARTLRAANIENLTTGNHGIATSSSGWVLQGTSTKRGIFTRQISIAEIDEDRRGVTSTVTWVQNRQRTGSISVGTRITNWRVTAGNQAFFLSVATTTAAVDAVDDSQVINVTLENTGDSDSTVASIDSSWSGAPGGTKLNTIRIDGTDVWTGNANSGNTQDITDVLLASASGTHPINYLDFSKDMTGATVTLTFNMSDASTKTVVFTVGAASSDVTAPDAVSDLAASSPTSSTIDLDWTAPGDDGSTGTASTYDIRYSTSAAITEGTWAAATQVTGEPTPSVAGSSESMTVTGLAANTTYYFALKTSDEVPNISSISNSPSETTTVASDSTAPAAVTDLAASSPSNTTIDLDWTAPGDDGSTGTASTYDIRYSTSAAITEGTWAAATQVTGEPTPSVAGSSESMTVSGLTAGTTYYFALKTSDEVPNISSISNSPSETTTNTTEADDLLVDISGVGLDAGDNTRVTGITLENDGASAITLDQMTVSWTGGANGNKLKEIQINAVSVWSGNANSGATVDITDVTLNSGSGTHPITFIDFSKNMTGATLSITFIMSDASTITVNNISP